MDAINKVRLISLSCFSISIVLNFGSLFAGLPFTSVPSLVGVIFLSFGWGSRVCLYIFEHSSNGGEKTQ